MANPTGDELALLKAIASAPDDDLPRLVFADWLEEHGRTERAEFIRLQIADERDTAWAGVGQRQVWIKQMLDEHRPDWLRELPRWVRLWYAARRWEHPTFRRGFVEEVSVISSHFFRFGSQLLDRTPLTRLDVYHLRGLRPSLAKCPWLGRVPYLNLSYESLEEEGAAALARNEHLDGILELKLCGCELGDAGVRALVRAWSLGRLKSLDLRNNRLSLAAVKALRGAWFLRTLTELDLSGNPQLIEHQWRIEDWFGERVRL